MKCEVCGAELDKEYEKLRKSGKLSQITCGNCGITYSYPIKVRVI